MDFISASITRTRVSELYAGFRIDAEFYQKAYVENAKVIARTGSTEAIGSFALSVRKGIFDIKASEYQDSGVPFIRIGDLTDGMVDWSACTHISPQVSQAEADSQVDKWDLILSKTGGPGVAINDQGLANVSQDLIALKTGRSKEYNMTLCAFLNGRSGRLALERLFRGNIQMHLSLEDVKSLVVPVFPDVVIKRVSDLVQSSLDTRRNSERLYPEAQKEMLECLQWRSDLDSKEGLSYSCRIDETVSNGRLDAEFYHPSYQRLRAHLEAMGAVPLGSIALEVHRGVQPEYVPDGEFSVINSRHLGEQHLLPGIEERTSETFFRKPEVAKAHLKRGDVLVYSTGAYVGRTNVFLDGREAIASNHVTIVRPDQGICDPVYLALFLNSAPGLLQSERFSSGSAQRELYPDSIRKFLVFLRRKSNGVVDEGWQKALAQKVKLSYHARTEAREKMRKAIALAEASLQSS